VQLLRVTGYSPWNMLVANRRLFGHVAKHRAQRFFGSVCLDQLSAAYEKILAQHNYVDDPEQRKLLVKLAHLKDAVESQRCAAPLSHQPPGFLSSLFRKSSLASSVSKSDELSFTPRIRGLYVFGGVGCGKTAMMDIFYDCLAIKNKHRTHFHSFMLDVHMRLHKWRQSHAGGMDPVPSVAAGLVQDSWVYCFDEFQVTDVADALIMKSLFSTMLKLGAVFLITSNRAPDDLYQGGTQRAEFVPFIHLVHKTHDVHRMPALLDYRTLGQRNQGMYTLASVSIPNPLWNVFLMLAKDYQVSVEPAVLSVMMGRELAVRARARVCVAAVQRLYICFRYRIRQEPSRIFHLILFAANHWAQLTTSPYAAHIVSFSLKAFLCFAIATKFGASSRLSTICMKAE
jgi:predicted ATPase